MSCRFTWWSYHLLIYLQLRAICTSQVCDFRSVLYFQAKSQFKKRSTANNVEIIIPVPEDADSPKFKVLIQFSVWPKGKFFKSIHSWVKLGELSGSTRGYCTFWITFKVVLWVKLPFILAMMPELPIVKRTTLGLTLLSSMRDVVHYTFIPN